MTGRETSETRRLVRAIVVLIRNTTWKCGRLERLIVSYLNKKARGFGKTQIGVSDIIQNFELTGKRKNEFLDAIRRLERRNIIRILSL
ncbi:MAG: hypothetical protein OEZ21_01455 [Candidatus Bathyarchaeota archaeon]|nr:hypothetical protein [Candidatus Bathyarchaeota archaeon]MDH5745610.1 hypothetical protein [Candidatus Bathyarchaeota archaeon]